MLISGTAELPRRPYAALPLGWAAVVLVLTLTPSDKMPVTPVWELLSFDTAAHAGVFAVLAGLSQFSLLRQRRWPRLARRVGAVVLIGCIAFGGLIEVLQHAMRLGRHGEWTDLLSDAIGAAVAVGLHAGWALWWRARTQRTTAACWFGLLLVGVAWSAVPLPARAQDVARARRTIEKLASASLHGRGYVKEGDHLAAIYLRGRFRELGLQPLAPNYTQPFTLDVNTFPDRMKLAVGGVAGPGTVDAKPILTLRPGVDFIAAPGSGGTAGSVSAVALRLDTAAFTDDAHQRQLQRQVRRLRRASPHSGPFLVLTAKEVQRLATLPAAVQQTLDSVSNRVVLVPKLTASLSASQTPGVRLEAINNDKIWRGATNEAGVSVLTLDVGAVLKRGYRTQNLAAIVRGTAQPDSFLVVSAHYDHLGTMGNKTYFPGANDNASGVALLLELAAHYARPENRPACSVVFLLFGAEEAGLVGSTYFVAHPLVPLERIKFLVNLDLLGTGEKGATVVNGKVFEAPYQRLVALNDAHHYLPALGARGRAANSDHFPFSEAGVPAFFIYTRGGSTAYHDVNDRPAALSLAGFAGAFGLVRNFLNALGAAK